MNASYLMGSRLTIYNAATNPISASSSFASNLHSAVRSHTSSHVRVESLDSSHIDGSVFE